MKYIKYGKKWEKEVMKNTKKAIMEMLRDVCKQRDNIKCQECGSDILPTLYCMMGHWCGARCLSE